jgi:intracellular septation protein
MKLLFDLFPILVFFTCYKLYGIYNATAFAMVAAVLQVLFYRLKHQRYEKMHLISLGLIVVLGGATLFFRNPWFIKWKPTGIYWFSSMLFLLSSFFGSKPLIQKMMEANIDLPSRIWYRLNTAWCVFFIIMGGVNLYVAYFFNTDVWVTFKLFGGIGLTLVFVFIQALYLTKHISIKELKQRVREQSTS